MSCLYDLPFDVLREIFSLCSEPRALTETCRYFSTVIYSLPKFCDIHIGDYQLELDLDPLRSRLGRISTSLRLVSIGKFQHGVYGSQISDICATLAEFNTEIKQLEINTLYGLDAGYLLSNIFPGFSEPVTFPKLQRLSVRVQTEYFSQLPDGARLDVVLEHSPEKFPNLQTLSLSDFFECISLRETPPFSNMHTLILDGSNARRDICTNTILSLLKHTPALETLWIKHVLDPTNTFNGRWESERNWTVGVVVLPRLTSLALSVNILDFLQFIEAPALRNLHLDAPADPRCWNVFCWNKCSSKAILDGLTLLAQRSINLRRLAFTEIVIREEDCYWLMFTGILGLPFPKLESLAIHRLRGGKSGWFDDAKLLLRGVENQGPTGMLSLRRLAILSCNLQLTGSVIAQALSTSRLNAFPDDGFELEVDDSGPQFSEEDISALTGVGVKLIRRGGGDDKTVEWWELGHDIDPLDSHVY